MDVLTKRQQMAAIHDDELLKAKLRKEKIYMVKKENYDAIISKNIPGKKLSTTQLRSLLNYKKRKNDTKFSHMKKDQLKSLWLEWKHRLDTPPSCQFNLFMSVKCSPVGITTESES